MTPEEQDCYDALREDNDCLKQENDALAARLAEAERDAERYRYLFRHDDSPVARVNAIYQMWDGEDGCAGFEAVIDAIMERK